MPEANSAPILSNPVSRYPRITPPEPGQKPKLLDRFREAQAEREIKAYLTYLPSKEKVSASTQNQAFSALLDPYKQRLPYRRQNRVRLSKSHRPGETEALNRTKPVD